MVESVFEGRRLVYEAVRDGIVDRRIIDYVLPGGVPLDEESPLWDYKLELPVKPTAKNDALQEAYNAKCAEIVKDSVAFYNSHGGYIIAGVSDADRSVVGFEQRFDTADLNQKICGATGESVETVYREIDISDLKPGGKLGLLFIPRRPDARNPAQFKKDAPRGNGKQAYAAQAFYLRQRDSCRPASSPEDFEFLYGNREFQNVGRLNHHIENNLPSREQDFTRLIGRDDEMSVLWGWLSDAFNPIKILSGLGGVGKTSIAFTFAERLIASTGSGLDRLIWLGAKSETFSGERDRMVPATRVDFGEVDGLLHQLLLESGCPEEQLSDEMSREEILRLAHEHLREFDYLLIVDNVDTLPDADQQLLFHLLTQICSATGTKCIMTARRNLGAPRSAFIEIEGLPKADFEKFVAEKASLLRIPFTDVSTKVMTDFHEASGGSPLFAMSVLRLVSLGDALKDAIAHWKGSDGDAVRQAAFLREIGRLKRNEARTLLALCYLGSASSVELCSVLGLSRYEVQAALEELQAFAMTGIDTSLPGGASFKLSPTLALVTGLVEQRAPDHAEIKAKAGRLKNVASNKKPHIAGAVTRAMAYIEQGDPDGALKVVNAALTTLPDNPDLLCLAGRCHQQRKDRTKAKENYQRAFELGCRKRELFMGWIQISEAQEDWNAVIDVCLAAEEAIKSCRFRLMSNHAHAQLGHERCRSGDYRTALDHYERAIANLHDALASYQLGPDRADLWRQNEEIVQAWLGAVRMAETQAGGDGRRLFGAYWKALSSFRWGARTGFVGAINALSGWLSRVEGRRSLSLTAREGLEQAASRLAKIIELAEARSHFTDEQMAAFRTGALRVSDRLSKLLQCKDE